MSVEHNKKTLLFTGGTGFIGRNILPLLDGKYHIVAPRRHELDLGSSQKVREFILHNKIDIIVSAACPTGINPIDKRENFYADAMKIFNALAESADIVEKYLYFGSGAEYDKRRDIIDIKEEAFGESQPEDLYGRAKYEMNEICRQSRNIYNLRLFGCFGNTDPESKFITHALKCADEHRAVTVRQDCRFDYLYVEDLADVIEWFIENTPKFKDYNICSGKHYMLSEIAGFVNEITGNEGVEILATGFNKEYTGNNERFMKEYKKALTPIYTGIEKMYKMSREIQL